MRKMFQMPIRVRPINPALRLMLVAAIALLAFAAMAAGAVALIGPGTPIAPAPSGPPPRLAPNPEPTSTATPSASIEPRVDGADTSNEPPERANTDPVETDAPKPTPTPSPTATPTPDYWQDGDRRMRLHPVATLTPAPADAKSKGETEVPLTRSAGAPPAGSEPSQNPADPTPQFQSDSGNSLSLPGGVLVVLNADWGTAEVGEFFASNEIKPAQITAMLPLPNTYLIATPPGLASLELANSLAGQSGVIAASPNWQREITTK